MIIFLRRIPGNTKKHEIIDFVRPVLKGGLFQKPGHIEQIKILVLKNTQTNILEFHGLVTIDPDVAAERIIKKLNRKYFKDKPVAVREFHYRSWHNDHRINVHERNEELINKRKRDRRRARLEVVENISSQFSSTENFHRSL